MNLFDHKVDEVGRLYDQLGAPSSAVFLDTIINNVSVPNQDPGWEQGYDHTPFSRAALPNFRDSSHQYARKGGTELRFWNPRNAEHWSFSADDIGTIARISPHQDWATAWTVRSRRLAESLRGAVAQLTEPGESDLSLEMDSGGWVLIDELLEFDGWGTWRGRHNIGAL